MQRHPESNIIWEEIRNPNCQLCPLHVEAQTVCLLGDGPVPCDGMVIGEGPGFREDSVEIPFSGRSGILLRRTLKEIGLDPRNLYITNVVACRPPGNRAPKRTEAKICSSTYLIPQIEKIKPKAILLLGNTALSFITGRKGGITAVEGTTMYYNGIPCIPSRHPSHVLRAEGDKSFPFHLQSFRENLLLFKRSLNSNGREDNFHFIQEFPTFEPGIPIYVDIETTGLNPFKLDAHIHCISLQAKDSDRVFAVQITESNLRLLRNLLKTNPILAQRGTFEGTWLKHHTGITPRLYHDTKLGSYLIDENEQSGLKYQAIKCLGVEPWSEEMNWQAPDFDKLLPYNARDTAYGLRLYKERDLPHLKQYPKKAKLLRYILLPAEEVFTEVICRGFHIDQEKAEEKLEKCKDEQSRLNGLINDVAGRKVNPGSPKQMVELLYNDLGLKCPVQTNKGKPSSSEAALIRLQDEHEIIGLLLEWRQWKKYDSTYLSPWLNKGPILHAGYDFTGTDTGRLSSSMVKDKRGEKKLGGTLHQCPRDPFIRNLISARDPDWCIVAADLSQVELRLVAHAANEEVMIEIFNNDEDIHLATAQTLSHKEIDKETRKKAKAVNFGFVYGMWPPKFVRYAREKFGLKLSSKDGERYREAFFNKYYGLLPWHRRVEAFVTRNGWIESVFGRRRHLPNALLDSGVADWIRRESVRQAINSPIQSAGSDLDLFIAALIASLSLKWKFKIPADKAFIIGAAHDSLLFECRRNWVKELVGGLKDTVDNLPVEQLFGFKFKVPIRMDITVYKDVWEGEVLAC